MAKAYPPTSLTATLVGDFTINLFWINHGTISSGDTSYIDDISVERKPSGGDYAVLATLSGTDKSYSDTSCARGTLYYYRVRGSNDPDDWSSYSLEASATTVLPAPTALVGVANTAAQITLTWEDNSTSETGFEVYMLSAGELFYTLLETTAANIETYVKAGLSENVLYYFKVRAVTDSTPPIRSAFIEIHLTTLVDPDVPAATLSNTGHQNILIIDTVSAEITKHRDVTVVTTVTISDILTRTFEIIATDSGTNKVDDTHADNGYPISSYIRTKDLDFTDQHPDLAGIVKTLKKFRLIYEDVDADTPVTVYISNDGGANWGTSVATLGTGDGTVKFADFYFMNSEYVTGLTFTFKVESLSTTKNFLWLAFELEFMVRGESFNV